MTKLIAALAVAAFAFAQSPPAFEVASVKPNHSDTFNSSTYTSRGELRVENASLKSLIQRAYDVRDFTFSGPDWLDTERFDILAKPPAGAPNDQFMPMLQTLLVERFKLAVHYESKPLSAYALLVAARGSRLQRSPSGDGPSGTNSSRGRLTGTRVTAAQIADSLARQLDRPVQDLTGLTGTYDYHLEWSLDEVQSTDGTPPGPSVFAALQEQLGLQLQARKLPVRILVVDRVERVPVEN